ncbi:V-type ATPase subunit [candidate division WOR-3 bacterium]|nr:V-type ATPase subunit [candidate division WOR-3 bacterium]
MIWNYSDLLHDNSEYAYETGVIRALETRLLDQTHYSRMIEAKRFQDAFLILHDTTYGKNIKENKDYDEVLEDEFKNVIKFFETSCKDEYVKEYYKSRFDIHNLKMFIKSKISNNKLKNNMLSEYGMHSYEIYLLSMENDNLDNITEPYKSFAENALGFYNNNKDVELLDIYIDNLYFAWRSELINKSNNNYLINLDKEEITLINIRTFARLLYFKNIKNADEAILNNGFIDKDIFLLNKSENLNHIYSYFNNTPYEKIVKNGYSYLVKNNSFSHLEKLCENRLVQIAKSTKSGIFGVEIVFAYLIAKENEVKRLRIILSGKKNNVAKEVIKERLPEMY